MWRGTKPKISVEPSWEGGLTSLAASERLLSR